MLMWFKNLEIKQAMKYVGGGECPAELLVLYCGRLSLKISPMIPFLV